MSQFEMFGTPSTKAPRLPVVGTCNARSLWLMLSCGWLDNDRLRAYGMGNASRRAKDLVELHDWQIVTRSKSFTRPDSKIVPVKEYRVDPVWLNSLVGSDAEFAQRLLLWSQQQNQYEQAHGGEA
ncbi:hypothetical protein [Cobetia sp. AM6]|uniref:hypothetical protein n=1 Tax=Cobetia sp. AM6 TaxID=2661553 RepID=UPI0012990582|nr:hypothetical protein [Cobetia sp. AM6]BBO55820.1 hypothetical protein CLAM6_11310 [Cobetia sp. AM6]